MSFQFSMDLTVIDSDLDELHLVNNAVYVNYIELIARAHADSLGIGWEAIREMGRAWVVRRHEIDYLKPARVGDTIKAMTRIQEIRGARAVRLVELRRGDEVLVRARTEWIWIDVNALVPVRIPPLILELAAKAREL